MGRRKRVLFVAKFVPEGQVFGGLMRTVPILAALRERYDVRVIGYSEQGAPRPRDQRTAMAMALGSGRAYQLVRYDTKWLRREIERELAEFTPDALHVEYLVMATPVSKVDLPKALDLHNVESALSASYAESAAGPVKFLARRDARLLRRFEAEVMQEFDVVSVVSQKEAERMGTQGSGPRAEIIPNGVDASREPLDIAPDPRSCCFLGQFSWQVNVDGAQWMTDSVLPLLPPEYRLSLVGRNPTPAVLALAGERVEVTGEVADTWPYIARSAVVVAPLLSSGGTRFKILEGLLGARPVVATTKAADGLEHLEGRGLVLADSPSDFAGAIELLAEDPGRASELGRIGREAVSEEYDWRRVTGRLLDLYESRLGLAS